MKRACLVLGVAAALIVGGCGGGHQSAHQRQVLQREHEQDHAIAIRERLYGE